MGSFFDEPVAGIHPLVWLAVFLVFGPPAIFSKTAAEKFGVFGAAARYVRGRQRRKIEQEREGVIEKHAMADVAYAALNDTVKRLGKHLEDQQDRAENQITSLRNDFESEQTRFNKIIDELREDRGVWEDYGEWVSRWATRQISAMIRLGVEQSPPAFQTFHEYKKIRANES